jgi:hypothetical protein
MADVMMCDRAMVGASPMETIGEAIDQHGRVVGGRKEAERICQPLEGREGRGNITGRIRPPRG